MCAVYELSTKSYDDSSFQIKRALSHLETLCSAPNGYVLDPPQSRFGWTFFQLIIQPDLQGCIESRFSDMISRYSFGKRPEKFTKFLTDYLESKGCGVKIRLVDF